MTTEKEGKLRIRVGNFKRVICLILGHDKDHYFAAPNIHWDCRRCGMDYFQEAKSNE